MAAEAADAARHMDSIYRTQRHIYDATRKFYLLGRDHLLAKLDPAPGAAVLEVACGTGRNLIAAARRYPEARFYGFDISREMLETAEAAVKRAGLQDRITLVEGDASDYSGDELFGVRAFDRVFISYAVSMIPPWREALEAAVASLASGGELHVVDFGQQAGLPAWFKRGLFAWLDRFSVTPRDKLFDELQRVGAEQCATVHTASLYRDYARYGAIAIPHHGRA